MGVPIAIFYTEHWSLQSTELVIRVVMTSLHKTIRQERFTATIVQPDLGWANSKDSSCSSTSLSATEKQNPAGLQLGAAESLMDNSYLLMRC